jgi:hypothetical protein
MYARLSTSLHCQAAPHQYVWVELPCTSPSTPCVHLLGISEEVKVRPLPRYLRACRVHLYFFAGT